MKRILLVVLISTAMLIGCAPVKTQTASTSKCQCGSDCKCIAQGTTEECLCGLYKNYLYVWTGDADKAEGDKDFLATLGTDPNKKDYGKVVSTTLVGHVGTMPHHIEPTVSDNNDLFASGFMANKIYFFDMSDPANPTLKKTINEIPGWKMSHSFIRRPDGSMIATLQYKAGDKTASGGLALFGPDGSLTTTISSGDPDFKKPIRSYGLDIAPAVDRLVTSSTPMAMESPSSDVVQIYRLSDLKLLHTLEVPVPQNDPSRSKHPFEVRVLPDGRSAFINSFQGAFYYLTDIDTDNPKIKLAYVFKKPNRRASSVPAIAGKFYVIPVQKSNEIVVLDISDPGNPREVSTLTADKGFKPHYASLEPGTNRIALTGFMGSDFRVMMMRINQETGALSWDESFRDPNTGKLGVDFARESWPHGDSGPAAPHGIVWSTQ